MTDLLCTSSWRILRAIWRTTSDKATSAVTASAVIWVAVVCALVSFLIGFFRARELTVAHCLCMSKERTESYSFSDMNFWLTGPPTRTRDASLPKEGGTRGLHVCLP